MAAPRRRLKKRVVPEAGSREIEVDVVRRTIPRVDAVEYKFSARVSFIALRIPRVATIVLPTLAAIPKGHPRVFEAGTPCELAVQKSVAETIEKAVGDRKVFARLKKLLVK